jgi:hypothetical protein
MTITFYCPHCQTKIEYDEESPKDGDTFVETCPEDECGKKIRVTLLVLAAIGQVMVDAAPLHSIVVDQKP